MILSKAKYIDSKYTNLFQSNENPSVRERWSVLTYIPWCQKNKNTPAIGLGCSFIIPRIELQLQITFFS